MSITDEFPYATTFIDDLQQNINPTTFYVKKTPFFPGQKSKEGRQRQSGKQKTKLRTVKGQYDYYIAEVEVAFLNSDNTAANISIKAYILIHNINFMTIGCF